VKIVLATKPSEASFGPVAAQDVVEPVPADNNL